MEEITGQIDPFIAPLVHILRRAGFNTLASCQGGEGHLLLHAWIRLVPTQGDFFPHATWAAVKADIYRQFDELIIFSYKLPSNECRVTITSDPSIKRIINKQEIPGVGVIFDINFWQKAEEFHPVGQHMAYLSGFKTASLLDNPYWPEYPKPSPKGYEEERCARAFVDGWCDGFKDRQRQCTTTP
jgi:hypothetical protein